MANKGEKMKKIVLAVLMVVLCSFNALAGDPRGAKEAQDSQSTKISYKLGKGLTFEVPDENFKLNLFGYVQPRFTYTSLKAAPDTTTFAINRAKIGLKGTLSTKPKRSEIRMQRVTCSNSLTTRIRLGDRFIFLSLRTWRDWVEQNTTKT